MECGPRLKQEVGVARSSSVERGKEELTGGLPAVLPQLVQMSQGLLRGRALVLAAQGLPARAGTRENHVSEKGSTTPVWRDAKAQLYSPRNQTRCLENPLMAYGVVAYKATTAVHAFRTSDFQQVLRAFRQGSATHASLRCARCRSIVEDKKLTREAEQLKLLPGCFYEDATAAHRTHREPIT